MRPPHPIICVSGHLGLDTWEGGVWFHVRVGVIASIVVNNSSGLSRGGFIVGACFPRPSRPSPELYPLQPHWLPGGCTLSDPGLVCISPRDVIELNEASGGQLWQLLFVACQKARHFKSTYICSKLAGQIGARSL